MPYRRNIEIPDAVKGALPSDAQTLWRHSFNAVYDQAKKDGKSDKDAETFAFQIAWTNVKKKFEKGEDGKWHKIAGADSKELSADAIRSAITEILNGRPELGPIGETPAMPMWYVTDVMLDGTAWVILSADEMREPGDMRRHAAEIAWTVEDDVVKVTALRPGVLRTVFEPLADTPSSEKAKKTEGGEEFGKDAFLYAPDDSKPSTWKLRIEETPGKVTVDQLGRAASALGPGFRGQKVEIPSADRKSAASRLITLYRGQNVPDGDIPEYLWAIAGMAKSKNIERSRFEEFEDTFRIKTPQRMKDVIEGRATSAVINAWDRATGQPRWITVSSGTFPDRMGEIVAKDAQEFALRWATEHKMYGPLRLAHIPNPVAPGADLRAQWKALVGDYVAVFDQGMLPMQEMSGEKGLRFHGQITLLRLRNLIAIVGQDLARLVLQGAITADVGTCDYQTLQGGSDPEYPGRFLVESGLWNESALAHKARNYFDAHPGEVSIGFLFDHMSLVVGKDGKVYPSYDQRMWRFERSLLPMGAAAFPAGYLDGSMGIATL